MRYYKVVLIFLLILIIVIVLIVESATKQHKQQNNLNVDTFQGPLNSPIPTSKAMPFHVSTGATPAIPLQLPSGYTIHVFASGLGSPRDLQFTPKGTLLVTDPADSKIYALPDTN